MTELIHKRKRLTEEEKRQRRIEHSRRENERMKRELKEAKAKKKPKEAYTPEELKEKRLTEQKEKREKILEKLSKNRPAMTLSEMIEKIDGKGMKKVANDLGIPVEFIHSWKRYCKGDRENGWSPVGTKLGNQLQDYLQNEKTSN
jgi:DNA invertase Pin-like site-specific DNA recombinase